MGIWFYTFLLKKIISLLCVHVNGIHQIYQDVNSCIILNHRIHKNIKPHTRWFHSLRQINVWIKLPSTWHCIEFDKMCLSVSTKWCILFRMYKVTSIRRGNSSYTTSTWFTRTVRNITGRGATTPRRPSRWVTCVGRDSKR